MQFTRREDKFLQPLLKRDAKGPDAISNFLFLAGIFVLAAGIVMVAMGLGRDYGAGLIFGVVGLIIIEHAWNRRDRNVLARIVQKYDAALRRLQLPEEDEVTR
jgi:hypothetical protein